MLTGMEMKGGGDCEGEDGIVEKGRLGRGRLNL